VTAEHLRVCWSRLRPHIDERSIAITGGVAMELHGRNAGSRRGRVADDLDLVATNRHAVAPSVASTFLVSHFHVPEVGYSKFLIQLVDPVSRVRVDIFPDTQGCIPRATPYLIDGASVRLVDPLSLYEHKIATLSQASPERRVDRKHYDDARALAAMCGRDAPHVPDECLGRDEYSRDVAAVCPRCAVSKSSEFPLARKEEILAILGYV